jgi:hypothetical protein
MSCCHHPESNRNSAFGQGVVAASMHDLQRMQAPSKYPAVPGLDRGGTAQSGNRGLRYTSNSRIARSATGDQSKIACQERLIMVRGRAPDLRLGKKAFNCRSLIGKRSQNASQQDSLLGTRNGRVRHEVDNADELTAAARFTQAQEWEWQIRHRRSPITISKLKIGRATISIKGGRFLLPQGGRDQ